MSIKASEVYTALADRVPKDWEVEVADLVATSKLDTAAHITIHLPNGRQYSRAETKLVMDMARFSAEAYADWLIRYVKSIFGLDK